MNFNPRVFSVLFFLITPLLGSFVPRNIDDIVWPTSSIEDDDNSNQSSSSLSSSYIPKRFRRQDRAKIGETIVTPVMAELSSRIDERLDNTSALLTNILKNTTSHDSIMNIKGLIDRSLYDATASLKQEMADSLNVLKAHYDHAIHRHYDLLHSFRQNTYDDFTDVKVQLTDLDKLVRTVIHQQRRHVGLDTLPHYPFVAAYHPSYLRPATSSSGDAHAVLPLAYPRTTPSIVSPAPDTSTLRSDLMTKATD